MAATFPKSPFYGSNCTTSIRTTTSSPGTNKFWADKRFLSSHGMVPANWPVFLKMSPNSSNNFELIRCTVGSQNKWNYNCDNSGKLHQFEVAKGLTCFRQVFSANQLWWSVAAHRCRDASERCFATSWHLKHIGWAMGDLHQTICQRNYMLIRYDMDDDHQITYIYCKHIIMQYYDNWDIRYIDYYVLLYYRLLQ